ncbi:MAG: hypothetical protein NVS1B4_03920 [Gemmatimonadaceae bacterium]
MAVREVTDAAGVRWRIWAVDPEELHPTTRNEAFAAALTDGWLVFERVDRQEKRRLTPIPLGWDGWSEAELRTVLEQAPSVTRRFADGGAPSEATAAEHLAYGATARQSGARSFRFPGGRFWTASLFDPPGGGSRVLRFMAGARVVDLDDWPADWSTFNDDQLSTLLRQTERRPARGRAAAAGSDAPTPTPSRRHGDRGS